MCNLREGFEEAPWRLREAFSKTRSAKASRSPLEGFAKASRRRHGRLHLFGNDSSDNDKPPMEKTKRDLTLVSRSSIPQCKYGNPPYHPVLV